MWTVIYIASDQENAARLKDMLEKNGILVRLRSLSRLSPGDKAVEILVPQSEAQEAFEIIGTSIKKK